MARLGRCLLVAALVATPGLALAQNAPAEEEGSEWSGSVAGYLYLLEEDDFISPVVRADWGALHLEGRYQYEDLETGSLWVGWTFSAGSSLELEATPMAGVVFGQTDGFAPGLEWTLSWKDFELYSESEYLFDAESSENNFFYAWSELSWYAQPWLRFGLSVQRTRLHESEREVDRGLFVGAAWGPVELVVYAFNLDDEAPFAVVGATASW
jgi:hypothetical protein